MQKLATEAQYDPKDPPWANFSVIERIHLNPDTQAPGLHRVRMQIPDDYPKIDYAAICEWSRARSRNCEFDAEQVAEHGSRVAYWPGSILNVAPVLGDDLVAETLELVDLPGDTEVTLGGETMSLRHAIATRFDNSGAVKVHVLKALMGLAPQSPTLVALDAAARDEKQAFGTTLDVMRAVFDETGVRVPQDALLKALSRPISCRRYTIASHVLRDHALELLVVESNTVMPSGRVDQGICSRMLCATKPGDVISAQVMVKPDYPPAEHTTETLFLFGRGSGYSGLPHFAWDTLAHGNAGKIVLATGGTTISEIANLGELEALGHSGVQVVVALRVPESAQSYTASYPDSKITFVGKDVAQTMAVPGVTEALLQAMRSGEARICGGPGPTGALADWLIESGHLTLYPEAQVIYDKFSPTGAHKGAKAKALRRHCMRAMELGEDFRGRVFVDVF